HRASCCASAMRPTARRSRRGNRHTPASPRNRRAARCSRAGCSAAGLRRQRAWDARMRRARPGPRVSHWRLYNGDAWLRALKVRVQEALAARAGHEAMGVKRPTGGVREAAGELALRDVVDEQLGGAIPGECGGMRRARGLADPMPLGIAITADP